LLIAWATLAIYYSNLPWAGLRLALAMVFAVVATWLLWLSRDRRAFVVFVVLFLGVVAWFISISPSHDRPWRPEVAVMPRATIDGDRVHITGVRNFDYRSVHDFTVRHEEREVQLSQLTAVDFFVSYWSKGLIGGLVGHTFLSFIFDNAPPALGFFGSAPMVMRGGDDSNRPGQTMRDYIGTGRYWLGGSLARATFFFAFWLILYGAKSADLLIGIIAAIIATCASRRLIPPGRGRLRPIPLVRLALRFLRQSIVAGIDVAWRALDPRMPLRPGFMVYQSHFPPGPMQNTFCTITGLLPGTLPSGSDENGDLVIHCLDVSQPVLEQLAEEEAVLRQVLGGAPDE
jgi:multisubunit Na+/H+ antiporter MnhE subunit